MEAELNLNSVTSGRIRPQHANEYMHLKSPIRERLV